jgi:hypothetical protein
LYSYLCIQYLNEFTLLESFSGDVQGQIVRVNYSPDESQVVGHHLMEVISDKYTSDVELDVVSTGSVSVETFRGLDFRDEEECLEGHFSLCNEMGLGQRLRAILCNALVELIILRVLNIVWFASPNGLGVIDQFPVVDGLGNFFGLWLPLFLGALLHLGILIINLVLLLFLLLLGLLFNWNLLFDRL